MSSNDATAFCQWLSRKEDKIYRLPTEAEWENGGRSAVSLIALAFYCSDLLG